MKKTPLTFLLLTLFSLSSFAQNSLELELEVASVTTEAVETDDKFIQDDELESYFAFLSDGVEKAGKVITLVDRLLVVGEKVVTLAKKARPNVKAKSYKYSILPEAVYKESDDLSVFYKVGNWSKPQYKSYKVEFKNIYGIALVKFTYTVKTISGLIDGGRYIKSVQVIPRKLNVAPLVDFEADVEFLDAYNIGTVEKPIAAMDFSINAKSVGLNQSRYNEVFSFISGGKLRRN